MGTFRIPLEVGDPQGLRYESVEALVDSRATYTTLPASLLRRLDVDMLSNGSFALADGTRIQTSIGQTRVGLEG